MSINACTINDHTINSACGLYSNILRTDVINYVVTIPSGTVYGPVDIGDFLGGPIISVSIANGSINGPDGTLGFSADAGPIGNIYFGGLATTELGTYTGQVRLYGTINFVTINFTINIVENVIADGGQQQHVHTDTKLPLFNIFRRNQPEDEIDVSTIEMPFVEVSIEFMGTRFAQTLERTVTDDIAVVSVSGLSLSSRDEIKVNISDIKITRIK